MKIYVASSWRNERQPEVVKVIRAAGHLVYDFKNPHPNDHGFHWSEIDPEWKSWTAEKFRAALEHPVARRGFASDMHALMECDACVLVLPCGRSAHLELGWAAGAGLATIILTEGSYEPELMYRMVDRVCLSIEEVVSDLNLQVSDMLPHRRSSLMERAVEDQCEIYKLPEPYGE